MSKCPACMEKLSGFCVRVDDGRLIHAVCLKCENCRVDLNEQNLGSVDEIRCKQCHEQKSDIKCYLCKNPIDAQIYKRVQGRDYHVECLRCGQCGQIFQDQECYPLENNYFCIECHWGQRSGIYLRNRVKQEMKVD